MSGNARQRRDDDPLSDFGNEVARGRAKSPTLRSRQPQPTNSHVIRVQIDVSSSSLQDELEQIISAQPDFLLVTNHADDSMGVDGEQPDIIIRDMVSEDGYSRNGSGALEGNTAQVLLTDVRSAALVSEVFTSGVKAILPHDSLPEEVVTALRAVVLGFVVIHPDHLPVSFSSPSVRPPSSRLVQPLTPREREVLQRIAEGLSNKEIAMLLSISEHTAKFHIASIMSKLGATSRTEAVTMAIRQGLLMI